MGEIGNGQVYWQKPWCKTKCRLDEDFYQPYNPNDELVIQMNLGQNFGSLRVCEIYMVDANGVRVSNELKALLGAAYYKHNTDTSGLNLFTFRTPIGIGCGDQIIANPNCCYIDIFQAGDPHDGSYRFFNLVVNGVTYDLITDNIPAGWAFINTTSDNKRYLRFPCDEVKGNIAINYLKITSDLPVNVVMVVSHCPIEFCDCFVMIPDDRYNDINRVTIGQSDYQGINILVQSPSIIPGISPNTEHTHIGAFWKVPLSCDLVNVADFQTGSFHGGDWQSVRVTYGKENCIDLGITKRLLCFAFEFVMGYAQQCGIFSFYSEPYRCTDANCEYNEATAVIYSTYPGKTSDTLGNWIYNIGDIGDPTMNEGALGNFVPPGLRIPANLLDLPTKVTTTKNEKCFMLKTEAVRSFKLQGTKAIPPYFARLVESIMLGTIAGGANFIFDTVPYLLARDKSIFEAISIPGMSAFKLNVDLEWCNRYTYFNCV